MNCSLLVVALCLLSLSGPCDASEPVGPSDRARDEIVVTGKRDEALRRFAESLARTGPTGQLARWNRTICPDIAGISPEQAGQMAQRIVNVARSVGLKRASSRCVPSMFIIVTRDANGFAKQLAGAHPVTLRRDGSSQLKRFTNSDQPVRWLALTNPCGGAGSCTLPNSRLVSSTQPTFSAMVVVVDALKLAGHSLTEVSDYLALVSLANPPTDRQPPSDSILSMFERPRPAGARYELTPYDRAFLKGLYRMSLDRKARSQQRSIATRMDAYLDEGESALEATSDAAD